MLNYNNKASSILLILFLYLGLCTRQYKGVWLITIISLCKYLFGFLLKLTLLSFLFTDCYIGFSSTAVRGVCGEEAFVEDTHRDTHRDLVWWSPSSCLRKTSGQFLFWNKPVIDKPCKMTWTAYLPIPHRSHQFKFKFHNLNYKFTIIFFNDFGYF